VTRPKAGLMTSRMPDPPLHHTPVISYLALLRMQELTFPELRKLILRQDPVKMWRLLGLLFDPELLQSTLKPAWSTLLDHAFVQEHVFLPLQACVIEAEALLVVLKDKVDRGFVPAKSTRGPTGRKGADGPGMQARCPKPPEAHRQRAPH
jgi:hypothetical protein